MCTRFVLLEQHYRDLLQRLGVGTPTDHPSRYNLAPGASLAAIRTLPALEKKSACREATRLRWGLVPSWARDDRGPRPVNARAESLATQPAFRQAVRTRRCVLPASGYYEWEHRGRHKQPWLIRRRDEQAFGLAGLWESWSAPDGTLLETCALVTTRPSASLQRIHDRMPVLLTPEQCEPWLDPQLTDPAALAPLLASAPEADLHAVEVGPYVSNSRHEGPACLEPAPPGGGRADPPQLSLGI
ncbi:MAG: SOS response-associated peptidase [Verrucomicrobiota bacterium]